MSKTGSFSRKEKKRINANLCNPLEIPLRCPVAEKKKSQIITPPPHEVFVLKGWEYFC